MKLFYILAARDVVFSAKKAPLSTKTKMSLRAPNGFDFNLSEKIAMATQNFY